MRRIFCFVLRVFFVYLQRFHVNLLELATVFDGGLAEKRFDFCFNLLRKMLFFLLELNASRWWRYVRDNSNFSFSVVQSFTTAGWWVKVWCDGMG